MFTCKVGRGAVTFLGVCLQQSALPMTGRQHDWPSTLSSPSRKSNEDGDGDHVQLARRHRSLSLITYHWRRNVTNDGPEALEPPYAPYTLSNATNIRSVAVINMYMDWGFLKEEEEEDDSDDGTRK